MEDITMSRSARNKTGAIYGVVLGLIYIILSTITNLTVAQQVTLFGIMSMVNYVLYFIILGIMAKMIRKTNGGFIEFKELFGTIFVILLVAGSMTYIYNWVFMNYIDPHFAEKVLEAARQKIEQSGLPDDRIDEMLKTMDKDSAGAMRFDPLAWAGLIVRDCVFGLIVAAIMKKSKPVFE